MTNDPEQSKKAWAEVGERLAAAMQETADAMARFAEVWRASEAAEELRKLGYRVPKP